MSELKWPCSACRNIHTCAYESSWRLGGENWFCPVLRTYVDQDSVNNQREVGGMKERNRDKLVGNDRNYLNTLAEGMEAKDDRMYQASLAIREMPDDNTNEMMIKAVASLSFFGMHQKKIASLLNIPRSTFYRIFRGSK